MKLFISVLCLIAGIHAQALTVKPCDNNTPTNTAFLVGMKTYSNGLVRVMHVDTDGEPACCSSHLLVYLPGSSEEEVSKCFEVTEGDVFLSLEIQKIESKYNPSVGLILTFPYSVYDHESTDGSMSKPGAGSIIINLKSNTVKENKLSTIQ